MQIGALGDIHGAFDTVQEIMTRHPDIPIWVQVGDVASNDGEYFSPVRPLYWIKGNNEDFDVIAEAIAGRPPAGTLFYLPNGGPYEVGPWRVAALGGTFVFLTHEAPRPFYPAGRRIDAGKTVINEVLAAMRPRLHLFGHHHEFTDSVRQTVRSIGLDVVTKSYLLIDAETFRCERLDT